MAVTPLGSPPWDRSAGIAQYGGHVNKENYLSVGTINPLTDIDAGNIMRIAADLKAVSNTAAFAVLHLTQDDSTPDDPTVNSARLMTGVATASYAGDAPPTGFPTVTRVSDGVILVTFSSSYSDDYSISADLDIMDVRATVNDDDTCFCTWLHVTTTNVVRIYTWDENGAAATDKALSVTFT